MILNNVILLKPILLININNYVGQQFSVLRTGISILHYIMITLAAWETQIWKSSWHF